MDTHDDHKPPAECEYIRGVHVYFDETAEAYRAYHNPTPVSSSGDTKRDAVENCRDAIEEYYDGEHGHWDSWLMACPACADGLVEPLRAATDDPQDTRVECFDCGASRDLVALPRDRAIRTCPTCEESPRLKLDGMTGPLTCPDCDSKYEIREITYLEDVTDG